jgi:hypothetical protein
MSIPFSMGPFTNFPWASAFYCDRPITLPCNPAPSPANMRDIHTVMQHACGAKPITQAATAAAAAAAGAAFIKWGQWAATRPDIFPRDVCLGLYSLHDAVPPHAWAHTEAALCRTYGVGAVTEVSPWGTRAVPVSLLCAHTASMPSPSAVKTTESKMLFRRRRRHWSSPELCQFFRALRRSLPLEASTCMSRKWSLHRGPTSQLLCPRGRLSCITVPILYSASARPSIHTVLLYVPDIEAACASARPTVCVKC